MLYEVITTGCRSGAVEEQTINAVYNGIPAVSRQLGAIEGVIGVRGQQQARGGEGGGEEDHISQTGGRSVARQ